MTPEEVAHAATDRPTWRRLVDEKTERIRAFECHVLPRLLDGLRPGARWLEIGCGLGWASAVTSSQRPDLRMTAVDLVTPYLADHAARLASFFGVSVQFVAADAGDLPFSDGAFDLVFSQHVLYRLGDPSVAIREAYRVLAPAGRWVAIESATPWCWPWRALAWRRFRERNMCTGLGEHAWTREGWRILYVHSAGIPATFTWATRKGRAVRWLTNMRRPEHLLVTVEKP